MFPGFIKRGYVAAVDRRWRIGRKTPTKLGLVLLPAFAAVAQAGEWPQFRGPSGSGHVPDIATLPEKIGPGLNQAWVVEIPPGVSSPVIHGKQLYLTGVEEGDRLVTFALDAESGKRLWSAEAPVKQLEKTDKRPAGRLATPSAASNGRQVVSLFGSSGLLCYDTGGKQLWHRPMGPFNNRRGAASSPVIEGNKVIVVQDHEEDSFLAAYHVETGDTVWHTDRMLFNRSYNTPTIWRPSLVKQYVLVSGSGLVSAYDLNTGKPDWYVQGTSAVANPSILAGGDTVYAASSNPGPKRTYQPDFKTLLERLDKNGSGAIEAGELPNGMFGAMFPAYDQNKDGVLSAEEYAAIQAFMGTCTNGMMAIKLGGEGLDRTATQVAWKIKSATPRTAAPLLILDTLYLFKDGGIFTSVNAGSGNAIKSERIPAAGKAFSSPVHGDGRIYLADDRGSLCVISAEPQWRLLHQADFKEPIYATPALCKGRVYVRTETKLYCFRQ